MNKPFLLATGATAVLVSLLSNQAHAIAIRDDVPVSSYNDIAQLPAFQSAAYLYSYSNGLDKMGQPAVFAGTCGGTLISPTKILSAAHCFVSSTGVVKNSFAQFAGFETNIPNIPTSTPSNFTAVYSPLYASGSPATANAPAIPAGAAANDIAIVTLNTPVTNVTPAVLFAGNPLNAMSAMVGYGGQNTGTTLYTNNQIPGANNRLGAYNTIDVANSNVLQFDFDSPDGTSNSISTGSATPLPLEGSVVQGDSGSALFALIDGQYVVTGDLNGGSNPITGRANNLYGERNSYAPVTNAANFAFIVANAPDAVFVERVSSNGVVTNAPVSDAILAQNETKFGSLISPTDLLNLAPEAMAVPEPASALLLGLGLGAAALTRRRKPQHMV